MLPLWGGSTATWVPHMTEWPPLRSCTTVSAKKAPAFAFAGGAASTIALSCVIVTLATTHPAGTDHRFSSTPVHAAREAAIAVVPCEASARMQMAKASIIFAIEELVDAL